jgi:hypothetical protein
MSSYQIEQIKFDPDTHTTKAMFWGQSGTGKTYSAATWPKPMLFLDSDDGLLTVVRNTDGIDRISIPVESDMRIPKPFISQGGVNLAGNAPLKRPKGYEIAINVLNDLHDPKSPIYGKYKTVVLDSLSSFSTATMKLVLYINNHKSGSPDPAHYGQQMSMIEEVILSLCHLRESQGVNIIVIAHDKDKSIKQAYSEHVIQPLFLPNVTGQLARAMPQWFDEYWYFQTEYMGSKKLPRYFAYIRSGNAFTAKTRLGLPVNELEPTNYETYMRLLKETHA